MNEVQVTCQVVSAEKDIDPDIPAMIGTSAALALSGIPFAGPIGAARVGFTREGYQLNPTMSQLEDSYLDMVVAGTESAVLMVESEAKELTEDQMLGAVLYAHQEMQVVIRAINEFAKWSGWSPGIWTPEPVNQSLMDAMVEASGQKLSEAYQISEKMKRQDAVAALKEEALAQFVSEEGPSRDEVSEIFGKIEKKRFVGPSLMVNLASMEEIQKPCVISALRLGAGANAWVCLITRGETQALVTTTLGSMRDAAIIDALQGSYRDPFMLHYNFPPYSVGETGFVGGPKRREIGHGRLARRGIAAFYPKLRTGLTPRGWFGNH